MLKSIERSLTTDEVGELFKQDEDDNFQQLIEYITRYMYTVMFRLHEEG